MNASDLRDTVTFQAQVSVSDGGGGFTVTWQDQFTVAARVMPGTVAERLEAGRLEASQVFIVRVRKSSDTDQITAAWRFTMNGEPYQIRQVPVDPFRTRQWLDLECERGVAT